MERGTSGEYGPSLDFTALALGAGVVSAGTGALLATTGSVGGAFDYLVEASYRAGNWTPFGVANTLRIPEFLSPYTSNEYKQRILDKSPDILTEVDVDADGNRVFRYGWDKSYFSNEDSFLHLQKQTGLSLAQLEEKGLFAPGMGPAGDDPQIVFEAVEGKSRGRLKVIGSKGEQTLLESAKLLRLTNATSEMLASRLGVSQAALSNMMAMDYWGTRPDFKPSRVFYGAEGGRSPFLPVAAFDTNITSLEDLNRKTSTIRSLAAFDLQRYNRLVQQVADDFVPTDIGRKAFRDFLGFKEAMPGPATHTYLRIGGRVARVAAVGFGVSNVDWLRRQAGTASHVGVSAAFAGAVGYGLKKYGLGQRKALLGALATFAGQMMPGMDQGFVAGLATTGVSLDVARASLLNPFTHYRRTVEGLLPGASGIEYGLLAGVGVTAAAHVRVRGKTPFQWAVEKYGPQKLGFDTVIDVRESVSQKYQRMLADEGLDPIKDIYKSGRLPTQEELEARNKVWNTALETQRSEMLWESLSEDQRATATQHPLLSNLERRMQNIADEFEGDDSWVGRARKEMLGFKEQMRYGMAGAEPKEISKAIKAMGFKLGGIRNPTMALFASTVIGQQLLTGGLLGSMEDQETLIRQYRGEEAVAVRPGRWWFPIGGSQYRGDEARTYYRTHAYATMMRRSKQVAEWGEDEDTISPLGKLFRKHFTYELEQRQYYERPAPLSHEAFEDIPVVGPLLARSIGWLIKPARPMHTEEWMNPDGSLMEPHVLGDPSDPTSMRRRLAFLNMQEAELAGMTGFVRGTMTNQLFGTQSGYETNLQFATTTDRSSARASWWDAELGDPGAFETVRRVLPNEPASVEKYNPLKSRLAGVSWVPKRYWYQSNVDRLDAEAQRLPGRGYAALFPHLKGVSPEDYPLLDRMKILAGLDPLSREFLQTQREVYRLRSMGHYTKEEQRQIDVISGQAAKQAAKYSGERVHRNAYEIPIISALSQSVWFEGQEVVRDAAAPFEYLLPFGLRPIQKLTGHNRDIVQQYEHERVYGAGGSMWDEPWRDWIRPAITSLFGVMDPTNSYMPGWRERADEELEYLDKIEFYKWASKAMQAEREGRSSKQYWTNAAKTRYGISPDASPLGIYKTLPYGDRKFFHAFMNANESDRRDILKLIPKDQRELYTRLWQRQDEGNGAYGPDVGNDVNMQYLRHRFYEVANYFEENPAPPEDWIGYRDEVSHGDVEVLYVDSLAGDLHDYQKWERELRYARTREQASQAAEDLYTVRHRGGVISSHYAHETGYVPAVSSSHHNRVDFTYRDDRREEVAASVLEYLR